MVVAEKEPRGRDEACADGVDGDLNAWLERNLPRGGVWAPEGEIAPLPPAELMRVTSGLTDPAHFASHGVDFMRALSALSPVPLRDFRSILDFGVGVGRLARMFHGFRGRYVGMDVDPSNIAWVGSHLSHVEAVLTAPRMPLPAADDSFDAVVSISVFSHLSERDHLFYLGELARVARPGATLMLSIHGARALQRAIDEAPIFEMLAIPRQVVDATAVELCRGRGYSFIRQDCHLDSDAYDYGITFVSEAYVRREWAGRFDVVDVAIGALHDFQDVVVLKAR
ncbi:class I SAM-dependent methyltransferase [Xanthobacter aminoxidans]|uniref:class I SAM-dependent methyltransferase n=1 Tax=Xanthobacter aminoxidans TaxID=186280 RepID=UPI002022E0A5|nr:class I SAM-dependent methyltransferase [Xanthobacter aminoxidans]MCL8382349.1 class I SAM-dependent methyltransferase [Xanthobacter aminoxidans]